MMRRREFITFLGTAAAWPLAARAQQRLPVIGLLGSESPLVDTWAARLDFFRRGLRESGYIENENVLIEYRWAEGRDDRLPGLAADLVRRQVSVIAAFGVASTLAAKAATTIIPIVFFTGTNPVEAGLVASLSRPGGNLTGVTSLGLEVAPKRLEFLHELMPAATRFAHLINPINPAAQAEAKELQKVAPNLGLQLQVLNASTDADFGAVFQALTALQVSGLVIAPSPFFVVWSKELAALALRHAVPAIFSFREFAAAGGLMSYGSTLPDVWRPVGLYTGRVLRGERPSDLPVQQGTKIELTINLKTAKTLGLTIPITLLGRADELIE